MRAFVKIFMLMAFAVVVSKLYPIWNVDRAVVVSVESVDPRQFIVLRNDYESGLYAKWRQECGNLHTQIAKISDIGNQSSEEGDVEYDEAVGDKTDNLASTGAIPRKCIVTVANSKTLEMFGIFESGGMVILSTAGDVAIGYKGQATMPWSEVIRLDSWRPDILVTENGSKLAIVRG